MGDVLVKIGDQLFGRQRTSSILSHLSPGQSVTVTGIRGGQQFTWTVKLGERPRR
jgi:S1-C subfamily serine protease